MIRLFCRGNVIEYTGNGWLQCSRSVTCPKKKNPKILGFDCFLYMDNLPENVMLSLPDIDLSKEDIIENTFPIEDITNKDNMAPVTIIPVGEFVRESLKDKGNGKESGKENIKENKENIKENKENIKENKENLNGIRGKKQEQRIPIILSEESHNDKSGDINKSEYIGDKHRVSLDVKALIQKIKDAGEV